MTASPRLTICLAFLFLLMTGASSKIEAQDMPSRYAPLQLSVFGEIAGVSTGLPNASNTAISGGADLRFYTWHSSSFAAEYRGTFDISTASIASEKSNLGGLRVSVSWHRVTPYGDALYGRGELTYYGVGYRVPGTLIFYRNSSAHVFAGGGGIDFRISPSFSLKLDAQIERYPTPVVSSGSIQSTVIGAGIVYRVHFPERHKHGHKPQ